MAMAGHVATRMAATLGKDSGPSGRPEIGDDCENTSYEDIAPGGVLGSPLEQTEMKSLGRSEPQGSRMEQNQSNDILRQMAFLCLTVQNLERRMQKVCCG